MTAEIAIINRTAVTLAADSAMSLPFGRGADKIYNSADKIFELAPACPIGIMVYNNLDFMGVPLEVAIKRFRDGQHGVEFASVTAAAEAFFDYLTNLGTTRGQEESHIAAQLVYEFQYIKTSFDRKLEEEFFRSGRPKRRKRSYNAPSMFSEHMTGQIEALRKYPDFECLWDLDTSMIRSQYGDGISIAIRRVFRPYPLDDDHLNLLEELGALMILKDYFSDIDTGLVFAGFGRDDLFPSLHSFRLDGMVYGRLKRRLEESVVIDRNSGEAEIVPFAQHEMADRFLSGIDPQFEDAIERYLMDALTKTSDAIIRNIPRASKQTKNELARKASEAHRVAMEDFLHQVSSDIKFEFKSEILSMVSAMPKPELASFAEALVNITSIKRKVSAEQESVGGPIDVAVISRGEGFVWVKRKHYFEPALNPRYFHRRYGMLQGPSERVK